MIYNIEEETITILMDQNGQKMGFKMKVPEVKLEDKQTESLKFTITPTNETKTISGYPCKKYLVDSEDNTGYAWVTEDVTVDFEKIFNFLKFQQKGSRKKYHVLLRRYEGFSDGVLYQEQKQR